MNNVSPYYDDKVISQAMGAGEHRAFIGGVWDELGILQFETLKQHGLKPSHTFLDLGCGCLRGGVHFIPYLDAGHYYGCDINEDLLDVGYTQELTDQDRLKLPRDHLKTIGDFDFSPFETKFDYALALSVFTHLPFNHIRICLERLASQMKPGGVFFATSFLIDEGEPSYRPYAHPVGGVTTQGAEDPYHYYFSDFVACIRKTPWSVERISGFEHPRSQSLLKFSISGST